MIANTSFFNTNAEAILVILRGVINDPMPYDTAAAILNSLQRRFVKEYESLNSIKSENTVYGEEITGQQIFDWAVSVLPGP